MKYYAVNAQYFSLTMTQQSYNQFELSNEVNAWESFPSLPIITYGMNINPQYIALLIYCLMLSDAKLDQAMTFGLCVCESVPLSSCITP